MYNYPYYQADDRVWVQGEVAAKAYPVIPGNTVTLWDSKQKIIYVKTVPSNGVPSMQKLSYEWIEDAQPQSNYITREEFEKAIESLTKKEEVEHE